MCEALNELFAEELREADLRGRKEGGTKKVLNKGKIRIKLAKKSFLS